MKSSKILEKNELYDRLLDSIDEKLSEGFKKPIITFFEFVSDEREIPLQPSDEDVYVQMIYVVSEVPEPNPFVELRAEEPNLKGGP